MHRRTQKMASVKELIRNEGDGTLSFGDYTLGEKTKKEGFEFEGNLYKVKTFQEITKLEKNGVFVYESVPGTAVENFKATDQVVTFQVSGTKNAQITLGMEPESEYVVYMNDINVGDMTTNISGKLSISAELEKENVAVKIIKK